MNELDMLIESAVRMRATDIHIAENMQPRIRIDGELKPFQNVICPQPQYLFEQILLRVSPFSRPKMTKLFAEGCDVDCSFSSASNVRIRANVYRTEGGVSFALRIIPNTRLSAEQIGIPIKALETVNRKDGLFLITGANGTGKTTTLAAIIDIINESKRLHVLTIEDPVEYLIGSKNSLISQREVGAHSPSFYAALRSAVRENPDVIVLGEMRDLETTRAAIELSETGHLVFATVHTRTAISTIDRLIGQFPAAEQQQIRLMVADNLVGVLSQTLLPRIPSGLIAAFEFLYPTPAARNLIRESKIPQIYSVIQTGRDAGMCTMEDQIINLVEKGLVKPSVALAKTFNPEHLAEMMRASPKIPRNAF